MLFVSRYEDLSHLQNKVKSTYFNEVENTFMNYFECYGWNVTIDAFNLNIFGPLILIEDSEELSRLLEDVNINIINMEKWILEDTVIYKFLVNEDSTIIKTFFVDHSICSDEKVQKKIIEELSWIRKYNGKKLKIGN